MINYHLDLLPGNNHLVTAEREKRHDRYVNAAPK